MLQAEKGLKNILQQSLCLDQVCIEISSYLQYV